MAEHRDDTRDEDDPRDRKPPTLDHVHGAGTDGIVEPDRSSSRHVAPVERDPDAEIDYDIEGQLDAEDDADIEGEITERMPRITDDDLVQIEPD